MASPMDLDREFISFNTEMNVDESLELNLDNIKIDEVKKPQTIQTSTHSFVISNPVTPNRREELSDMSILQSPTKCTPMKELDKTPLPIEKYKNLVISSASKRQLQKFDEKMEDDTNKNIQLVEPRVVSMNQAENHKIQITIDPEMLLKYLSVISRAFVIFISIGISIALLITFYYEVNEELRVNIFERQAELDQCRVDYNANHCNTMRAPKMQEHCIAWEKCMRQDPFKYNTMVMIPKVLGKVVEHFVDVLSLKTLLFIIIILIVTAYTRKQPTYIMNMHKFNAADEKNLLVK